MPKVCLEESLFAFFLESKSELAMPGRRWAAEAVSNVSIEFAAFCRSALEHTLEPLHNIDESGCAIFRTFIGVEVGAGNTRSEMGSGDVHIGID